MRVGRILLGAALVVCGCFVWGQTQPAKAGGSGHYLFAWAGDAEGKGNDFLAVIDADPASPSYGGLLTTVPTEQKTMLVHHTEYTMPASGMLFANDHYAGSTFIFDVRDGLRPRLVTSFSDMDGYMHPHSYVRLPNGHVLATFQHMHHAGGMEAGGLVEIDDAGKVIRSASSADPAFPGALLTPYSLAVIPEKDRVISTNSSMHLEELLHGVTLQVWRLSDLKLLRTMYVDVGENHYAHVTPQEPRLGPDGAVYVQSLSCGLQRVTGVETDAPKVKLVYTFPGQWCGVPTVVGHYLVQSVRTLHGLVVLDISNGEKPVEVSRLVLGDSYLAHWTGWDPKTHRLVVTSGNQPEDRLFLVKLDPDTGAVALDENFRDTDGKPGFSFADRQWPHGWKGSGAPHGAVFSR